MRVRHVFAGLLLLVAVVTFAADGGSTVSNKPVATGGGSSGGSTKTTAAAAHVGATIAVGTGNDKANVTLVQVIDPASGSDQFTTPDAGKRFVGVKLTIADTGSTTFTDDANSTVTVIGSDNQTYTADFSGISECTNFNNGTYTLAPNQNTTGCVTFQLPTAVTATKVEYQPTGFGGTTGEWLVP
jgi:hypothetical protein